LFEHHAAEPLTDLNGLRIVYRGERSATSDFKLLPALLRDTSPGGLDANGATNFGGKKMDGRFFLLNEFKSLYKFYLTANKNGFSLPEIEIFKAFELDPEFDALTTFDNWIPEELFEIAGLAQHYGVPTRLLDWTFNPFTALYFAAMGAVENLYNEMKSAIDTGASRDFYEYKKDDRIVIWALHIDYINAMNKEFPDIRLKWIRPPYNRNPNLTAQLGLFTHVQQVLSKESEYPLPDRTPLNEILRPIQSDQPFLFRHMIPVNESNHLLTQLQRLQYSASRIFTGFGGVAKEVIDQDKRHFVKKYWPL
jgi:hypothetical protein